MHSYYLLPMLLLCPLSPPFVIIMPNSSISIYLFDLFLFLSVSLEFLPLYLKKRKTKNHTSPSYARFY